MTDLELTQAWVDLLKDKAFKLQMEGKYTAEDRDQLRYAEFCLEREKQLAQQWRS